MDGAPRDGWARLRALLAHAAFVLGLLGLVLGLVWSWPRARDASNAKALRFVLVDVSSSARTAAGAGGADLAAALADEARAAEREGAELCVLTFGRGASVELESGGELDARSLAERLSQRREDASELSYALDLVERVRSQRDGDRGRIVVVGDASFTGIDPAARIARLSARGFACVWRALAVAREPQARLGVPVHARALPAGTVLSVRVPVHARDTQGVRLRAAARWSGGEVSRVVESARPAGALVDPDGFAEWSVGVEFGVVGPGGIELEFVVAPENAPPDARSGLDRARSRIVVGGAPTVALVGADAPAVEALRGALEAGGEVFADVLRSEREAWSDALRADVVVTLDVPPAELPEHELGGFLRGGGGWLAFLGERSRAAFHRDRGAFEMLPLVPPEHAPSERDVVFLVDGSGSMAGDAQRALFGAIVEVLGMLAPEERVEFRWFAGELFAPRLRQPGSDRAAREAYARELFGERAPGGPTRLVAGLEQWIAGRSSGRDALVFVFSDGHDSELAGAGASRAEAVLERARKVAKLAEAARTRVVSVSIGDDANDALLDALVTLGGRRESGGELSDARERILRILAREVGSVRGVERGAHAVVPDVAVAGDAGSVVKRQLKLVPTPWSAIEVHTRASAAEGAEVAWRSGEAAVLLGLQRVGLGRTAGCAFAPGTDAPAWLEGERAKVFVPLIQSLAAGRASAGPVAVARGARVEVSGVKGWPARVAGVVRIEGGVEEAVVFEEEVGAETGVWVATWSGAASGADRLVVEVGGGVDWSRVIELGRAEEERFPRRFWRGVEAGESRERDGKELGDPRAWVALVVGVVGVFLGVLGQRGRG